MPPKARAARPHRGLGAYRQDHRHRLVIADRPYPALNPATYTRRLHTDPRMVRRPAGKRRRAAMSRPLPTQLSRAAAARRQGDGVVKIEMHFLPDVYVTCGNCEGKRCNRATLGGPVPRQEHRRRARDVGGRRRRVPFTPLPRVREPSRPCAASVSLHPFRPEAPTLSGGEAQRVSWPRAAKRARARTIYILTSRPPASISAMTRSSLRCCTGWSRGQHVVVIEHNLEVIKCADRFVDPGPEGGDGGGEIVA